LAELDGLELLGRGLRMRLAADEKHDKHKDEPLEQCAHLANLSLKVMVAAGLASKAGPRLLCDR
jgi:hypothetical protein